MSTASRLTSELLLLNLRGKTDNMSANDTIHKSLCTMRVTDWRYWRCSVHIRYSQHYHKPAVNPMHHLRATKGCSTTLFSVQAAHVECRPSNETTTLKSKLRGVAQFSPLEQPMTVLGCCKVTKWHMSCLYSYLWEASGNRYVSLPFTTYISCVHQ